MRTLVIGATFAVVAFGAAVVGAPLALDGSDALFNVTSDVLASCATKFNGDGIEEAGFAAFGTYGITYAGGGSGVGAAQMDANLQHVAPMARTLSPGEMCSTPAAGTAVQATSEALEIGLDGIVIAASATNTCANTDVLAGSANGLAAGGQTFTVSPGGTTYTLADSLDVLRLVYFGIDHDGAADCNGPVRRSLVASWANLFSTGCATGNSACGAGLRHAWRTSDLSGTAEAFVSLVGVGATGRGIGNNPFPPGAVIAKRTNPFCNSYDANTSTPGGPAYPACSPTILCPQNFACSGGRCILSANALTPHQCGATIACPAGFACDTNIGLCAFSDGGMSDFSDWDPIRSGCAIPTPGTTGLPLGYDAVCSGYGDRTLGLVLPIYLPDVPGLAQTDLYPTVDCDPGACDLVAPARIQNIPVGFLCPDGEQLTLNRCWASYHADPTAPNGENFNCRADRRVNHCFGLLGAVVFQEGRVYNMAMMKPDLQHNLPGANVMDANGRLMAASFFRIRQGLNAFAGTDPSPCPTQPDATSQIGCLTSADACSIGFAAREAAPPSTYKALSIDGVFPTDAAILALIDGSPPAAVYPFARRLYLNTIYGFGMLTGGEDELARCFGDNVITRAAVTAHSYVPLPVGVQCLDYDESDATTAISEAAGKIPGNCGPALNPANTNHNACTDPATGPVIGPTVSEVYNILTNAPNNCVACHSGAGAQGGLDLGSLAAFEANTINVPATGCSGKLRVVPGASVSSYLIDKLLGHSQTGGCFTGAQMPLGGPPLTAFQIAEIAQWIDD